MKIAIQGHPIRGKEVIQILESLGGINRRTPWGHYTNYFYYISSDDNTIAWTCIRPESNVYTLEEFEKEFPFKVGDIVLLKGVNHPYKIIALEWYMDKLCYRLDNGLHYRSEILTTYKEMKEERNIKLTLTKAKEWYSKGGELKEIALQAYSKEELNKVDLPKTWEEFCGNYPIKEGESYAGDSSEIYTYCESNDERDSELDRNMCPTPKSAEAHLALIQLEQLRDCWRQGWRPNWNNAQQAKCYICYYQGKFKISTLYETRRFLSFPTQEIAEEFLKCFKNLIEQAGDFI